MPRVRTVLALVLAAVVLATGSAAYAAPPRPVTARFQPFDLWFNGSGYSPRFTLLGGEHRAVLGASCDPAYDVVGQLYHWTLGIDPPIGDPFPIPCEGATSAGYTLNGGEYYFYFFSNQDNTYVNGDWR
ncbi:hypothetical protein HDA40_000805 [Hamadaea flava]|uniref:Uncharacterized protein n=1 Tax=Hamadaea flava TaxID=1742688 RepID=A0ABV8LQP2_9ACTN|nr:hypothetical protein [Hamadaea flava]MCP2322298.1 hypothetical protein [Hamadaea flava]